MGTSPIGSPQRRNVESRISGGLSAAEQPLSTVGLSSKLSKMRECRFDRLSMFHRTPISLWRIFHSEFSNRAPVRLALE